MAANFPGSQNSVPGVYVQEQTIPSGISVPSGTRLAVIMGEGSRQETLVVSALGGGKDGLDPTYTSNKGADGRHFALSLYPIISNRSQLFRNGIPLVLLEEPIDDNSFDDKYDARIDIETGHIELQTAQLVDQGGSFFTAAGTNVGDGTIENLDLVDENAPTETWTIRCTSVRRDGSGNPIDGYARFTARGTVSGIILDGYGNQIVWQSNGTTTSNTILTFDIVEGSTAFREGDAFVVKVKSGELIKGDGLSAIYIAESDINDPEFFTSMNAIVAKHGAASLQNRVSLGAQIAFANSPPGVFTLETAPSIPRRVSYELEENASGSATADDLSFPLPLGVVPDVNSNINFFITDPLTGVESQIIPNKTGFYDSTITSSPNTFTLSGDYVYSYTVVLENSVQAEGIDGVITYVTGTTGTLSSETITFNINDLSDTTSLKIFDASNSTNNGTFTILSVANGIITLSNPDGFITESDIRFEVIDSSVDSAIVLFTKDLALTAGQSLRATVVDTKDATFFDAGWINAYAALETIDIDMVVPLPSQTISAIFQNGKAHVEDQSDINNKHERILLIGAIAGLTPENVLGQEDAAVEDIGVLEGIQGNTVQDILDGNIDDLANYDVQAAFGDSFRVVYMYPDQVVVQVGGSNVLVDGFFMAPAAAAFFSAQSNVNVPLTNKTLSGFTIQRNKLYSPTVLGSIAAAGITVLQPVIGGGLVIWGKTTTDSGFAEEEEISIVFIRDAIANAFRVVFKGFVGTAETLTFQTTLFGVGTDLCNSFVNQNMITAFKDLSVEQDSVEPRQYNVEVAVAPVYPNNWIYIKVNVGAIGS